MKNIIEAKDLAQELAQNPDHLILIDTTSNFMDPAEGRQKYDQGHIKGAHHVDLHKDMVGKLGQHGGRDPLPQDMNLFAQKLESLGIQNDSNIVVYDQDLVPSSRFWWMCKYIGINNVRVLNGGINAWKNAGYPLSQELPQLPQQKGSITLQLQPQLLADINDIVSAINDPDIAIVDSRSNERYLGINEPIDKKAGHIPGALNYFFGEILDPEAGYKDIEFLQNHFKELQPYKTRIVHCGSGVSGSVNIIAMDEIGMDSKFYIGSWSDYITYEDSVIVEKESDEK